MSIGDRILSLYKSLELRQQDFAELIDVAPSTISYIVNNDSNPNYTVILKILEQYPNLNAEWLCRGIGQMWKSENQAEVIAVYKESLKMEDEELLNYLKLVAKMKSLEKRVELMEHTLKNL